MLSSTITNMNIPSSYDRRHDEPHRQGENGQDDEQGHHDAEYAVLQSALLLQEEDERINHVSQNPGDEEWQQHAGEAVDKQHDSRRNKGDYKPAHNAVEGNFTV